jgi:hypothetical protein
MPSFDVVIEPDLVELRNAVEQANKEIGTRFDFKGTSARVELAAPSARQREVTVFGDSAFQLEQVRELLLARLAKRGVDLRFLDFGADPQKIGGDRLRWPVPVKSGIDAETARKIQAMVKAGKLKVQAAVQGDTVRVTGAKRDDLQATIALLRKELAEWPLSFDNFRA